MYVPASKKRKYLCQQGFALLEVALAMVLLAVLAGKVLFDDYEKIQALKLEAQGQALKTLQAAHNNYIVTYYDKLANGVLIVGPDDLTVTVEQLVALNVGLPPGFSNKAIIGGQYKTTIVFTPAGCPGGICQMEGLVWIDKPYLKNGKADSPSLGLITRIVGPDAAYSSPGAPSLLEGLNWTTSNPQGSQVGVIGVRTGYNSSGMAQFLRRDGSLPMTGALNMGDQNIGFVKDITATGTVAGKDLTATTSITSAGTIKAGGRLTTDEFVQINGVAVAGTGCSPNGLIARDAAGLTLSCQSGSWKGSGETKLKLAATFGPVASQPLGRYQLCIQTGSFQNSAGYRYAANVYIDTDYGDGTYLWFVGNDGTTSFVTCFN